MQNVQEKQENAQHNQTVNTKTQTDGSRGRGGHCRRRRRVGARAITGATQP
jgi:hypothetical protein